MVVLDTDHMSLLDRGGEQGARLRSRLSGLPSDQVATTIISFEEQMRGWMAYLARTDRLAEQVEAYRRLLAQLTGYSQINILGFSEAAAVEYQRLRSSRLRVGTMDLKIAAIALANGAILLSRNLAHFRRVHVLRVEDWTG
jgi:tRNA(fMet)-specific endonuclease VapC